MTSYGSAALLGGSGSASVNGAVDVKAAAKFRARDSTSDVETHQITGQAAFYNAIRVKNSFWTGKPGIETFFAEQLVDPAEVIEHTATAVD